MKFAKDNWYGIAVSKEIRQHINGMSSTGVESKEGLENYSKVELRRQKVNKAQHMYLMYINV